MRAEIGTVKIESWINVKKVILETLANKIKIKQSYNNMEELQRYLTKQHKGKEDILAMYISKVDSEYITSIGWVSDQDFNPIKRQWYIGAIESENIYIREPYIDMSTNQLVITLSKKIVNNGVTEAVKSQLSY